VLNHQKQIEGLRQLRQFIDRSLALSEQTHTVVGFHYNRELLAASVGNTYLETVGDKADTLYRNIKAVRFDQITHSMLDYVALCGRRKGWEKSNVILAFDYTDEEFYGDVQGFYIHGWTGRQGITGKFKFLTCSIVASTTGQRVPLLTLPIMLGHSMSKEILYCLSLLRPIVQTVELILFDRGFYCKELMDELNRANVPYLIFIPKNDQIIEELKTMKNKEQKSIVYEFEYTKDKTTHRATTYQAFLKAIYCKKLDQEFDWAFATNVENIVLDSIISTYKQRWNIETGFRVQDEASIKCKSTDITIRYFLFVYEQLLQIMWGCFYQPEVSFKRFLIEMSQTCNALVK